MGDRAVARLGIREPLARRELGRQSEAEGSPALDCRPGLLKCRMPAARLYYADSTLTRFTALVTDIRERSRTAGASLWQIALDHTAFYPTSGGQPFDVGTLRATAPSGAAIDVPIVEVEEDEAGEVWHLTPKPLLAGTAVEGTVDTARRRDHMQQHSGQHLLSALFHQELDAATVSFHLGDTVSTIDLERPAGKPELTTTDLEHIERLANDVVAQARPMTVRTVTAEQARQLLSEGRLRKLPTRDGDFRLVVIPGAAGDSAELDLNACGGTHVARTSEIGAILLRGTERVRKTLRVSFVCGDRAIGAARGDDALLTQLSRELSAGRADLPMALQRLRAEQKAAAKERQTLREELANYHAARLLVEDPPVHDLRVVRRVFADRDLDYVKLLASRVTGAAAHTVALFAAAAPAAESEQAMVTLVVACSPDLNSPSTTSRRSGADSHSGPASGLDAGQLLKSATNGRGGGSSTLAQGVLPRERLQAALDTLEATLRG